MHRTVDTCYVRIQLYLECTNSTLPSIVLDTLFGKKQILKLNYCISNGYKR